jgi:hypothetical protein
VGGCAVGRGLVRGALSGEVKEARLRSGGNESTERGIRFAQVLFSRLQTSSTSQKKLYACPIPAHRGRHRHRSPH